MNKAYKYTLSSGEKKEITFDVGVQRLAITNANGEDGGSGVTYTAGENIQISEENVISATDTTYTAGSGIAISEQNVISNIAEGNTDIIAEEYDSEKSYAVGDYCIYDNKLYRCISAIAPPYWYKIPKRFSSGMNFTNTSANPQDCYVTVTANGHWVMASAYQNQTIHIAQFSFYDFALNSVYGGTESTGYYNGYDYSDPNIIAQYFPNGGYASESTALADLFSRPYFDTSKWTEVTVTDEIKDMPKRYDIYTTNETVVGTWYDGKPIYRKLLLDVPIGSNTVNIIDSSTSYKYLIDGIMCIDGMTGNAIISNACAGMTLGLQSNSLTLVKRVQADYSGWNLNYVIVYYTKTNDYD